MRASTTDITEHKQVEAKLCSSEKQIHCLFEFAPIGMLVIDAYNGRILQANLIAQEMWGYTAEEFLTKTASDITYPDDLAASQLRNEQLANGLLDNHRFEKRYLRKDGSHFWGESCVSTLKAANGKTSLFIGNTIDITKRRQAEDILRFHGDILNHVAQGINLVRIGDGTIVFANTQFERMFGYGKDELIGKPVSIVNSPRETDPDVVAKEIMRELEKSGKWTGNVENIKKDGTIFWCHATVSTFDHPEFGRVWVSAHEDITRQKQTEANLRIAATAFQTQEGITVTDANGTILSVNQAFTDITCYTAEEAIGKNPRILSSGLHDAAFYAAMWKSIHDTGRWEGDIWNRRKNKDPYLEHLIVSAVRYPDGTVSNYVGTLTDITISSKAAAEIQNLAFYDPLTQLPNRRLLQDRANQALASCDRNGQTGALLFIDLDNFKIINDTLGHGTGDLLLQEAAERLKSCVRIGDTVARLGGDEFVVMLEDLSKQTLEAAAQAEAIGWKILARLNQPYCIGKQELHNSPSIGITLFNSDQREINELYKQADIAMYQAKKSGRNTLRFFDPQMQEALNVRSTLESDLHKAVECHQFFLYYQTQVDNNQRPLGAEALIRWIHAERGLISPAEFIPIAEETGLILPIGKWVLETACAQLKTWELNEQTRDLILSVNVSAKQFHQADFVAQVESMINRYAINPTRLKLELTESILLDNIEGIIATMNEISALGVRFSLDDFGTGYSSLQYLKQLPLHQLKIDQSFVRDLAVDSSDKAIVNTIIAMAQSLNLEVIAEGVETEEQRRYLENAGCKHYQGYLFGKPMPIKQFKASLK